MATYNYAPILQEVPAFIIKMNGDNTAAAESTTDNPNGITAYFADNPGVTVIPYDSSKKVNDTITGLEIKLKNFNDVDVFQCDGIYTTDKEKFFNFKSSDTKTQWPHFIPPKDGEYYKCQIRYRVAIITAVNPLAVSFLESDYSPWSDVVITRCLGSNLIPTINICDLEEGLNYYTGQSFSINYSSGLPDEKLYQYKFTLYKNNNIIQTSGWQDYLSNADNNFIIYEELLPAIAYQLKIEGKTVNGYILTPVEYDIIRGNEIDTTFNSGTSKVELDKDNGVITITIKNNQYTGDNYEILRKEDGNSHLEIITEFKGKDLTWHDYSVEQGKTYTYLIRNRHESTGQVSRTVELGTKKVEFEDMFLSDANRQLKIKFNPQISSLKNTILEQKTDTIGSKYPFFFRNGNVNYKEIPISGLISYHMDDQEFFINKSEIGIQNNNEQRLMTAAAGSQSPNLASTNLTENNFTAERKFKLEVLEWLTNGQPKLFRSPAEGNYVVRLMNTSLSPNEQLGRMLHTFSTTGHECMTTEYSEMLKANIVKQPTVIQKGSIMVIKSQAYDGIEVENEIELPLASTPTYYNLNIQFDHVDQNTRIELDGFPCYVTSTTFSTSEDIGYKSVKVNCEQGNPFTLTYTEKTEISRITSFPENDKKTILKLMKNDTITMKEIYAINIQVNEGGDTSLALTIDGVTNTIDCSDGQSRYYTNIRANNNIIITKGAGLDVTIYGKEA